MWEKWENAAIPSNYNRKVAYTVPNASPTWLNRIDTNVSVLFIYTMQMSTICGQLKLYADDGKISDTEIS